MNRKKWKDKINILIPLFVGMVIFSVIPEVGFTENISKDTSENSNFTSIENEEDKESPVVENQEIEEQKSDLIGPLVDQSDSYSKDFTEVIGSRVGTQNIPNLPEWAARSVIDTNGIFYPANSLPRGIVGTDNRNIITLTSHNYNEVSTMWAKNRLDLTKKSMIEAYIYLGDAVGDAGEGMTIALQNEGSSYLALGGGALGLYTGYPKVFALEIDQGWDSYYDVGTGFKGRHVSFFDARRPYVNAHWGISRTDSYSWSNGTWRKVILETAPSTGDKVTLNYVVSAVDSGESSVRGSTVLSYNDVFGTSTPYWGGSAATGSSSREVHAIAFVTLPQEPEMDVSSGLDYYVGEKWTQGVGLGTVKDENGKQVYWGDPRLTVDTKDEIFTSPGKRSVTYTYKHEYTPTNGQKITKLKSEKVDINVKEDKSSLVTRNSTIKLGEKWNPSDNFVSATDKNGKSLTLSSSLINTNGANVDTSKAGIYKLKYSNTGAPSGIIDSEFTVEVLDDRNLQVNTKSNDILLGTNVVDISGNQFIDKVQLGDRVLKPDEYIVEIINKPATDRIGKNQIELRVILREDTSKFVEVSETAEVVWGSTLVIKNDSLNAVDASVSLLEKNGSPHLNSNTGSGFSGTTLTSRPTLNIYRGSEKERIVNASYVTVGNYPATLVTLWNDLFNESDLKYGDVLRTEVYKFNGGTSWKGKNTFVSRENTLVTETEGYDYAYYELTSSGYRLMHLNQFTVNNTQRVALNTSKEEMNKNISQYIKIPDTIGSSENFRLEFESVDTESSGNKTSQINVYEKLESGGEFLITYEVNYVVDPAVTESTYDITGTLLEDEVSTPFKYGEEFTPSPTKYKEVNGDLYIYRGWSETKPNGDNENLQGGTPSPTKVEKDYYYIYDKAEKFINVTLPTEMIFGTFDETAEVKSKNYPIKNNSHETDLQVILNSFDKINSDVQLLGAEDADPTTEETSAKLNLLVDQQTVVSGLKEDGEAQEVTRLEKNKRATLGINGKYFGSLLQKNSVEYQMNFKFKVIDDSKK